MSRDVDIHASGPVFDGRADRAVHDYERAVSQEVAEDAERRVQEHLHRSIRHPTGYYESHVRVVARSSLVHVVTDGGVVYGSWLEGTGSRNRTTRFKGYRSFRQALEETNSAAVETAERILPRYTSRME